MERDGGGQQRAHQWCCGAEVSRRGDAGNCVGVANACLSGRVRDAIEYGFRGRHGRPDARVGNVQLLLFGVGYYGVNGTLLC